MESIILQILLIQAYFAIGLISVTFPIYAICVGYLRKETVQFEHEQKNHLKLVKEKIFQLTKKREMLPKDELDQIDAEIKSTKEELKNLENQYRPLTATGAVRNPVLYLSTSLFISIISLLLLETATNEVIFICSMISFGFIVVATFEIYGTITSVEHAALRTDYNAGFEISFARGKTQKEIRLGQETELKIFVSSCEDVDNFDLKVFIRPEIEIRKQDLGYLHKKLAQEFTYAGYSLISRVEPFFQKKRRIGFSLTLFSDKEGEYIIPIWASGKGIKKFECELILNFKK